MGCTYSSCVDDDIFPGVQPKKPFIEDERMELEIAEIENLLVARGFLPAESPDNHRICFVLHNLKACGLLRMTDLDGTDHSYDKTLVELCSTYKKA